MVQRVGDVAEVVGVATLPSARRRGYASQLTASLARDALQHGADLVFLSAGDDDVARLYSKVGFRRIGTACIGEPPRTGAHLTGSIPEVYQSRRPTPWASGR